TTLTALISIHISNKISELFHFCHTLEENMMHKIIMTEVTAYLAIQLSTWQTYLDNAVKVNGFNLPHLLKTLMHVPLLELAICDNPWGLLAVREGEGWDLDVRLNYRD
ncbi:hypothetical protein ACJX0J_040203, partial [Zea mays]